MLLINTSPHFQHTHTTVIWCYFSRLTWVRVHNFVIFRSFVAHYQVELRSWRIQATLTLNVNVSWLVLDLDPVNAKVGCLGFRTCFHRWGETFLIMFICCCKVKKFLWKGNLLWLVSMYWKVKQLCFLVSKCYYAYLNTHN